MISYMIVVHVFHMTTQYDALAKTHCDISFKLKWSYYQVSNIGFQMVSSRYKKRKLKKGREGM